MGYPDLDPFRSLAWGIQTSFLSDFRPPKISVFFAPRAPFSPFVGRELRLGQVVAGCSFVFGCPSCKNVLSFFVPLSLPPFFFTQESPINCASTIVVHDLQVSALV